MLRTALGLSAFLLCIACALTPESSQQLILGKWSCHAESQGAIVDGKFDYMTGGKAKADAEMSVDANGMKVWVAGLLDATWGFQPDGKLIETVTGLKVTQAKMAGRDVPPMAIGSMVQPMVNEMVVGQSTTSTVVFDGATMTSTDTEGVVTTCKR